MNTSLKNWELELLNERFYIESGYRNIFLDVLNSSTGNLKEYEKVMRRYLLSEMVGSYDNLALLQSGDENGQ